MLGRGTGPLGFRSGRLAGGDDLSAAFGRLLCKSRLCLLPLYTTTVVRCVVTPAATALRLFPRGKAATGEMGASTSDALGCVSAVALSVALALAAPTLQRAIWSHVRLHRHSQTAEFGSDRTLGTSVPPPTDIMKWGWEGGPWRGPGRDGRNAAE